MFSSRKITISTKEYLDNSNEVKDKTNVTIDMTSIEG